MEKTNIHIIKRIILINVIIPFIIFIYDNLVLYLYNPCIEASFLDRILSGSVLNFFLLVFVVLATPCAVIIGLYMVPVKKALNDPSLIELAKKRITRFPILVLVVYFAGFLSGPIVSYTIPSTVKLNDFIYVFLLTLFSGFLAVSFSLFYTDMIIAPIKKLYGMHTVTDKNMELSLYLKYIIAFVSGSAMIWCVTQYIGFYYFKKGELADTGNYFANVSINIIIVMIASIVQLLIINNNVKKVIFHIRDSLKSIIEGNGDLTKRITVTSFDELGLLISDFNLMIRFLDEMIGKIKSISIKIDGSKNILTNSINSNKEIFNSFIESIGKILTGIMSDFENTKKLEAITSKIDDSSKMIYQSVKRQQEAVQYSSSSIEEMTANIRNVTDISQNANSNFKTIMSKIDEGKDSLKKSISAINNIYQTSKDLVDFVNTISDISERIKLLAINASIEAARAGKTGEGFAVVALEVRKLSEQSSNSVKNIEIKLNEINEMILNGTELINSTGKTIEGFFSNTEKSISVISNITNSMTEQEIGTRSIEKSSIEVQENNSMLTELAKKGEELSKEMKNIFEYFFTSSQTIYQLADEQKGKNDILIKNNVDLVNASDSLKNSFEEMGALLKKFVISTDKQ